MIAWDKDKQRKQTDRKPVDPVDYASDSFDPVASVDPAPVPSAFSFTIFHQHRALDFGIDIMNCESETQLFLMLVVIQLLISVI